MQLTVRHFIAVALLLTGCHATVQHACDVRSECREKLSQPAEKGEVCAEETEKLLAACTPAKRQRVLDCLASLRCDNAISAGGSEMACFGLCEGSK